MAETKRGRQTPTKSVVIPYTKTRGQEAITEYNATGRTAQEWQELLACDILATNEEGLWVHTKFGYSLPRRNGKNEVVAMRELWGLMNGEHILHTAHRTTTSATAWERLCSLLDKRGVAYKSIKATGRESIRLKEGEGRIEFRTRSAKGGLGEGFDLLVIDEAQEYTDDQESALKYVVSDSQNPQTILCGTPPTPISSGTVFTKLRQRVLEGGSINTGWAEWSVDEQSNPRDRELWYETNPSLGTILSERKIFDEIGSDIIDFNIQRLGLWLKYNQKSAITKAEWEQLKVTSLPKLKKRSLYIGVKYGHDGSNVALSVAVRTEDGKIFVEAVDCRPVRAGNDWIIGFLKKVKAEKVVIDGANGQAILAAAMKEEKMKAPVLPTVKEIISANALFEQCLFSETICHMNQPSLTQSVSNCEKRAIGTNGGFGYRSQREEVEIALLDSVLLAVWSCYNSKEKRKQQIRY